jgi:purine-binding chemotaxis protein CheW
MGRLATQKQRALLVFRVEGRRFALPIESVEEVMRPLSVEPLADVPAFVVGVSIVRGEPTPVVDLAALVRGPARDRAAVDAKRMITVKTAGARRVGVLVGEVVGVQRVPVLDAVELPSLLADAEAGVLETLGRLDGALLTVLRLGHALPSAVQGAGS